MATPENRSNAKTLAELLREADEQIKRSRAFLREMFQQPIYQQLEQRRAERRLLYLSKDKAVESLRDVDSARRVLALESL